MSNNRPQFDPLATGFLTDAVLFTGQIANINIANAGTNYSNNIVLTFDAPPYGGIQATATAYESGGIINVTNLTNVGALYVTVPNIAITGGDPGIDGALTAVLATDTYYVTKFDRTGAAPVVTDFAYSDGGFRGIRAATGKETATMTIQRRNAAQLPPQAMTTLTYDGSTWVNIKTSKALGTTEAPTHQLDLVWQSTP